jgi:hypothetical protein
LGETKRRDETSPYQKKRRTYRCWSEKALPAYEGPLGCKKKRRRNKDSALGEERRTHTCRAKKALSVDEGSLGAKQKPSTQTVMKISKLREDYSKTSAKLSELVRQLSFAGIAVIWILRTGEHAGGIKYSNHLLLPLASFVASLAFDLLQYVYKTIVTASLNWCAWRKYRDEEKDVPYSGKWNWPTNAFF